MAEVKNVLFLCTSNAARSIMAEAIMNDISINKGLFKAYSAGSNSSGTIHAMALAELRNRNLPTNGLSSKSWNEFINASAPELDFVITVGEDVVGETSPAWPGQPMMTDWRISDPAAVEGRDVDKKRAFVDAFRQLRNRIELLTNLPWNTIDKVALQKHLNDIGKTQD